MELNSIANRYTGHERGKPFSYDVVTEFYNPKGTIASFPARWPEDKMDACKAAWQLADMIPGAAVYCDEGIFGREMAPKFY